MSLSDDARRALIERYRGLRVTDVCDGMDRCALQDVGLLDWDEARVDHPDLDLADLPVPVLPGPRDRIARAAVGAWEAAAGWAAEPAYARRRLAELAQPG